MIKGTGYLCLFLVPCLSYYLFEYVTGNLENISIFMAALNICWAYVLYLVLTGITGTTRISVPVVSIALLILSFAETFVVDFRDRPIMIWDVLAVRTAMTVSGNYEFDVTKQMIQAAKAVIGANMILWFFPVHVKGLKKRLVFGGTCIGTAAAFVFGFFHSVVPAHQMGINMWAVNDTYDSCGYILSTAMSLQYVVKKPPVEYSHGKLEAIYKELTEKEEQEKETKAEGTQKTGTGEETVQPVNLICIMNESLSDLRVVGDFSTNQEYFPFINSLTENTIKGNLCMPVFGSMTSNSEFEFLTGDSVAMLPSNSIAYQFNVKPDAWTMVSTVKDQGYRTVAMHPYPGENWNRNTCYTNMGFDEFLDGDYYEGSEQLRYYTSDQADFEKLIQIKTGYIESSIENLDEEGKPSKKKNRVVGFNADELVDKLKKDGKTPNENVFAMEIEREDTPHIIALSGYNELLKQAGEKPLALKDHQAAVYLGTALYSDEFKEIMSKALQENIHVTMDGKTLGKRL